MLSTNEANKTWGTFTECIDNMPTHSQKPIKHLTSNKTQILTPASGLVLPGFPPSSGDVRGDSTSHQLASLSSTLQFTFSNRWPSFLLCVITNSLHTCQENISRTAWKWVSERSSKKPTASLYWNLGGPPPTIELNPKKQNYWGFWNRVGIWDLDSAIKYITFLLA